MAAVASAVLVVVVVFVVVVVRIAQTIACKGSIGRCCSGTRSLAAYEVQRSRVQDIMEASAKAKLKKAVRSVSPLLYLEMSACPENSYPPSKAWKGPGSCREDPAFDP